MPKQINEENILQGRKCPDDFKDNLKDLIEKINKFQELAGFQFLITSGFRTSEDQERIYKAKGMLGVKPKSSKHFYCQAVDIYDPHQKLQAWVKENADRVEEIGLWFEDFNYTSVWVHAQIVPPGSGKRFFIPYIKVEHI